MSLPDVFGGARSLAEPARDAMRFPAAAEGATVPPPQCLSLEEAINQVNTAYVSP